MSKILTVCLFISALHAQTASPDQMRTAATRAIAIVQRGASGFYKSQDCFSCHNHGLPMIAFQVARERGVAVDEAAAAQVAAKGLLSIPDLSSLDKAVQDPTIIDPVPGEGWALIAADAAGLKPNPVTAAYARRIAAWQRADGHWLTGDARPPQGYSSFTMTAVAARVLQLHMPAQLRKETGERLAHAKSWLLSAQAQSTEDSTFRLLGLNWAGATAAERVRAVKELLSLQRAAGGWAELPHMEPDAYSTGEALVALNEAGGIPVTDPAWQKGLRYLLSTQDDQGAWHVHTRQLSPAQVSPPYLESGFPHGHDQYISTAATCWGAMAMMLTLPKSAAPAAPQRLASLEPKGLKPWMETAMFGSAAELKTLLDGGLDPNSKTSEGTTALMMAAADAQKVKLLIDRGADVNAKAKSGFTALIVAATYPGTSESVKLMLAKGADAKPGTGVLFNASPLFMAVMAADRENIATLLAKGADVNRKMNVIGMFPSSAMLEAVTYGETAVVQALLKAGADVHEKDPDGLTLLDWAVIAHRTDTVKGLLSAGADKDVNAVDKYGYTALMYAATIDFGDAELLNALLKAGADPHVKDKAGKTALSHATSYPYLKAALEKAGTK